VTDAADTATVARLRKRIKKLKRKLKHYRKLEAAKAPPISELLTAEIPAIPAAAGRRGRKP
jgi:hypothetical protein